MASRFKYGESVFFAFRYGESVLDCQIHPRMYRSAAQFKAKFPFTAYDEVKLVEYAPIVHGRWIPVDEKQDAFDCSECDAMVQRQHNFCPKCGQRWIYKTSFYNRRVKWTGLLLLQTV